MYNFKHVETIYGDFCIDFCHSYHHFEGITLLSIILVFFYCLCQECNYINSNGKNCFDLETLCFSVFSMVFIGQCSDVLQILFNSELNCFNLLSTLQFLYFFR